MTRWRNEFSAEFTVPACLSDDARLTDTSWHNDVCPSFVRACDADAEDYDDVARLWVDHPDASAREMTGAPRYLVLEGQTARYAGESLPDALAALLAERVR